MPKKISITSKKSEKTVLTPIRLPLRPDSGLKANSGQAACIRGSILQNKPNLVCIAFCVMRTAKTNLKERTQSTTYG